MNKIILSEMDANFKKEIASKAGAEQFQRCFTCGTCTAACPVAEVHEDYDPRKIIRMSILGMKEEVLSSDALWMCSRCYTCYALCPQGVKFTDVLGVLREMAVAQGYAPKERMEEARKLDKFVQELRCDIINQKLHPENDVSKIQKKLEKEINKKW
ncbi:MAG: 4Fe-4S dicluster domain-containing protein [Candidatus Cloacimonetes bacterium]|nr:4Fe-4S dicluster domain-containing protein [Candidatus Cloacimonadota bacterium]MBT7469244.1 4Fe-4S dicluster domain-containing protein [Candidatus Cloacimonadota bacterium]